MELDDNLFSDIGIDSIGFYAPRYFVDLEELAKERKIDPKKYKKGLLLKEMRLTDLDEDIVSIGLKAGYNALIRGDISPKEIDAVFLGTETITYAVKSISNIFADLLDVSENCITQDVYNACAAGTLAIINAIGLIKSGVIKKALVISADISSYSPGTPAEPTQGSGAAAVVIAKNPRIAVFSNHFGKVSGNINDFFRLANGKDAQVFGHFSVKSYLNLQLRAYDDLRNSTGDILADYYAFHAPFSKLPLKCMQQIIQKRWVNNINNILKLETTHIGESIIKKIDSLLQNMILMPEHLYLKIKELGIPLKQLDRIAVWIVQNLKSKVLPQLKVPMHFGNMYSASVWAQIIYILESYAFEKESIYFGSYGAGATCISGLLKVLPGFKDVVDRGMKVNDYIEQKVQKSVKEYETMKNGNHEKKQEIFLGRIVEHEKNRKRGFTLHFCDKGCIISGIKDLNYCPKGHPGFHKRFFPLYAVLESEPVNNKDFNDLSFLKDGYVRLSNGAKKGDVLEYEIRRIEIKSDEPMEANGLLDWTPTYVPISNL